MPDLLELLAEPPRLTWRGDRLLRDPAALNFADVAFLIPGSDPAVNAVSTVDQVRFQDQ